MIKVNLAQTATRNWERNGETIRMVKTISSQLYISGEQRHPIQANHSDMVKFTKRSDDNYKTVVSHIQKCIGTCDSNPST